MNLQTRIETCPNLPTAKKIGRRAWMLTAPGITINLHNADADAFEQGYASAAQGEPPPETP